MQELSQTITRTVSPACTIEVHNGGQEHLADTAGRDERSDGRSQRREHGFAEDPACSSRRTHTAKRCYRHIRLEEAHAAVA